MRTTGQLVLGSLLCLLVGCETQSLSFGGQPSEVFFASTAPKPLPSYIGGSIRPGDADAYGFVIGSLGSAGNDGHLISRRLTIQDRDLPGRRTADLALVLFATGMYAGLHSSPVQATTTALPSLAPARSSTFVLKLRPGEYRLSEIEIASQGHVGPALAGAPPHWRTRAFVSVPFTVKAGRSVYLGELLSAVGTLGGQRIVYFLATDQLERDLRLIQQYTDAVQPLPVDNFTAAVASGARPTIGATMHPR